jgi:hypothetical protein
MFFIFFGYFRRKGGLPAQQPRRKYPIPEMPWLWQGAQQRQSLPIQCGRAGARPLPMRSRETFRHFATVSDLATVQSEKSGTEFRRSFDRLHREESGIRRPI